jgi:hypothetical protein
MSTRKKTGLLIVSLLVLSACSELQYYSSNGPAPVIHGGQGVNYWLADLYRTRDMTPDQQQQTLESWEQEFSDNPNSNNRLRVALLLATGSEEVRDQKRALKLLDEIDTSLYDVSDREMITVLRQFLGEEGEANRKIHILWKQVTEQNRRIEELEKQLQALTSIEQKIQQREKPVVIENGK